MSISQEVLNHTENRGQVMNCHFFKQEHFFLIKKKRGQVMNFHFSNKNTSF